MVKKCLLVVVALLLGGGVIVFGPMHLNKRVEVETESAKQITNEIEETSAKIAAPDATVATPNQKSQLLTPESSNQKDKPISSEGKKNSSSTLTSTAKTTTADTASPIWKNMVLGHVVKIYTNSVYDQRNNGRGGDASSQKVCSCTSQWDSSGRSVKFYFTIMSNDTLLLDSIQKVTEEELDPDRYNPISEQTVSVSFLGMEGQLFVVSAGMKQYTLNPNEDNKRILQNANKGDKFTGTLYTYTDGYQMIDLK